MFPQTTHPKSSLPIRLLEWINTLCLDVVIGSLLSGGFVVVLLKVKLPVAYWFVLAISVWIIYMLDHLVDAYRLKQQAHTIRHRFAFQYFNTLSLIVLILTAINFFLVIRYLGTDVLYFGLGLGLISLLYLAALHFKGAKRRVLLKKEFIVAFIYLTGIWGVPLYKNSFQMEIYHWLVLLIFFLLVLADILLLSFFEREIDIEDKHPTLAVRYGAKRTGLIVQSLGLIVTGLSAVLMIFNSDPALIPAALVFMVMAGIIINMSLFPQILRKNMSYRYISEMVFWLPGVLIIL